jgi:hypothetical protein
MKLACLEPLAPLNQNAHCQRLSAFGALRALPYIEAGARNLTTRG